MVDKADVYIGIFAFRYGYVPDGEGFSSTEMEYQRAVDQKKPRLLFFMDKKHPITMEMVETGPGAEKLVALKDRAGKDRVARFFKSPAELRGDVIAALHELKPKLDKGQDDPAEAAKRLHRRTPIPVPPTPYIAHPYTLSQTRDLVGRHDELNALTDWVAKPGSPAYGNAIFCFVAIGGMGKSALTWKWFNDIAPEKMPDLAGRLWWSFYESDAHFENFLNRALCYVGELGEDDVRNLPWQDRENLLLQHLNEKPYLLVLDGLERILLAYNRMDASSLADDEYDEQTANHVAGPAGLSASVAQSFTGQHRLRQTTDPRVGHFFRKLAQVQNSRVLVSTRLYPLALQLPNTEPSPACFAHFLTGLSEDDAVVLWRALGVSGSRQELVGLFRCFENHPLLVQALAGEVARHKRSPGDFVSWRNNNPRFDPTSLPAAQVKSHILQYALAGLDDDLRETLTNVVALRSPATYDTLEALLVGEGKTFENLQGLDRALTNLEDRGLIGWDRDANRYDAHPIVRGVAWRLASKQDQKAVYRSLDAHFEPMDVPSWRDVNSIEQLTPAIERYYTLIGLRQFDDAFDVFRDQLERATRYRLAAHRDRVAWIILLFPEGISRKPALVDLVAQAEALDAIGASYDFLGRPTNAIKLYRRCMELREQESIDYHLRRGHGGYGDTLRETGTLREAAPVLKGQLSLRRRLDESQEEIPGLVQFARLLNTIGDVHTALLVLGRSLKISGKWGIKPADEWTASHVAEILLRTGDGAAAKAWADAAWKLASIDGFERHLIRGARIQGQAALVLGDLCYANERLHHALVRARAANMVKNELQLIVTLANLELQRAAPSNAHGLLDDVWEPAREAPYPMEEADAYNVLADICLVEGNKAGAIEAATKAYRAAWCDGPPWAYHWGLEKAKAHLQSLNAPFPDMPPFDESKFEPLPEVEINPKDEYWVDPNQPLEALLDLDGGS